MRRSVIALTTICLAGVFATPALADPTNPQVIQVDVHVSPSDLATDEAVAALYQRVTAAASSICAEAMASETPNVIAHYSSRLQCEHQVVRDALEHTRFEALARYYAQTQEHGHRSTELAAR
ncbi:MAG: UrcA family protein [Pseudomonadota bacterium]